MQYISSFFQKKEEKKEEGKDNFTGIKDLDAEILLNLEDKSFIKTCNLNSYFMNICEENDGLLFKRKLQRSYPDTIQYKNGTWKNYYASVVKAIALLEEKHKYKYTKENPLVQLNILERWQLPKYIILEAGRLKQYSLLEYMLIRYPHMFRLFGNI